MEGHGNFGVAAEGALRSPPFVDSTSEFCDGRNSASAFARRLLYVIAWKQDREEPVSLYLHTPSMSESAAAAGH
jgi:hypothetical protein